MAGLDSIVLAVAQAFQGAWDSFSKEIQITDRSSPWWNEECTAAFDQYRASRDKDDWRSFRRVVKTAKRIFFDERIDKISNSHKRPWDLMNWVQQRKNPPCEAIQYNGRPCLDMPSLWDALHNTYNLASNRPYDIDCLNSLPDLPVREWVPFSALELEEALSSCSSSSAPGPDHITWVHLKSFIQHPETLRVFIYIANACLRLGHWPSHFKESSSVIIPKPGKPSYSAPKAFRPIVLLNTLGKLVEKMISNRIQFDAVALDIFHPNQVGGVCQRSTEDAGLFLTHIVRAGWAQGLKTSVVAFDVAQFFPSLNHDVLVAILRKQGFPPNVVKFFEHYLVGRSTRYAWNSFVSDPRQADVGVGQGSALSPVLSALYLTPIIRLYELDEASRGTTLLSYVDDGTILVQSKSLDLNNEALKRAYAVVFELFTKFALALEHDKSELFHFDRSHSRHNPSLDLGYAPYTGDHPLTPKTYWRYLGFYFDRKLTFREHVRYYSTKALSTVKAMGMLGNSSRGLLPQQKRLLYRSCVVPIATYGYRLWYFEGGKYKANLSMLNSAQRKAALWICGAFRTSPTGGVEALAGLPPIRFVLKKLAYRSVLRVATLSATHPIRSLMSETFSERAVLHEHSIALMRPRLRANLSTPLTEVDNHLIDLTEKLAPFDPESRPGYRLLDLYKGQVIFHHYRAWKEDALATHRTFLESLLTHCKGDPRALYAGTDASLPREREWQATSAFIIYRQDDEVFHTRHAAGRVTSADAELYAIRGAVVKSVELGASANRIIIFTDSIGSAKRAVDPSVHSGQAHSLAVCRALDPWLSVNPDRRVLFVQVPSRMKWGPQFEAHELATSLRIARGVNPANSLDTLRKAAADSISDAWTSQFQHPDYRGRQFLALSDVYDRPLRPRAPKGGGPWLEYGGRNNSLFARMCRCITGHAPIGSYYERFNIQAATSCPCGARLQTRFYLLSSCRLNRWPEVPSRLFELVEYLERNPGAFAFTAPQEGVG